MEIVWIAVGICYIIYKLQQEEKIFSAKSVLIVLGVAGWIFIPWFVCLSIFGDTVADLVSVITFGIPIFILCVYNIVTNLKDKKETLKLTTLTCVDRNRQNELSRMSDTELESLLGVPFDEIPSDGKGLYAGTTSHQRKRRYAIAVIMLKEGLLYSPNVLETQGGKRFKDFVQAYTPR